MDMGWTFVTAQTVDGRRLLHCIRRLAPTHSSRNDVGGVVGEREIEGLRFEMTHYQRPKTG